MTISRVSNLATGFRKWSTAHPPAGNDNDHPGGATPIALTAPKLDNQVIAPPEQPHRPWLVPGMGTL
jgi:hypothetical protein